MKNKQLSYNQAISELDAIISQFEKGEVEFDKIQNILKNAKELFDFCQNQLHQAKDEVDNLIKNDSDYKKT